MEEILLDNKDELNSIVDENTEVSIVEEVSPQNFDKGLPVDASKGIPEKMKAKMILEVPPEPTLDSKKVLFFISDNAGCGWYRGRQPAKYINTTYKDRYNLSITNYMSPKEWGNFEKPKYDLFIHQRQYNEPNHKNMIYVRDTLKVPQCYEIDDDLFHISPKSSAYHAFNSGENRHRLSAVAEYIRKIDYLTVSTEPLMDLYSQYKSMDKIFVVPNAIDLELFSEKHVKTNDDYEKKEIIIGWTGSNTHHSDIAIIDSAITQVVNSHPNVKLLIGGWDDCPFFKNIPKEKKIKAPWTKSMDEYVGMISKIDIAVCPLEDTVFNRGKSNLKVMEAMSLGIPVVASNVFPYGQTIINNENGKLVKPRHHKWVKALEELLLDVEMRKSFGKSGRKLIQEKYDQKNVSKEWCDIYDKIT